MSRTQHSGGFTLVEALAAGLILAVSATVLGLAVSQSMESLARARDYQKAGGLLDGVLRRVDYVGPTRLLNEGPTEGVFDAPDDGYTWQVEITPLSRGHLHDVTARLRWRTAGGQSRSAEVRTLLNDEPGSRPEGRRWEDL